MITEFRRLVFSSSDLISAIKTFSNLKGPKLPDGDILGVEIIGDSDIRARIQVSNIRGTYEKEEVEFEASYLAAAMLLHCIQSHIPIPKSAIKSLERVGDGLSLSLSINADPQPIVPVDD